jgi:hypothetical protein
MKNRTLLLVMVCLLFLKSPVNADNCSDFPDTAVFAVVKLKNNSKLERIQEVVEIDFNLLSPKLKGVGDFKVVNGETGEELVYQVEYKGADQPKNLLVQVTLPAEGEVVVHLKEGMPSAFAPQTFARYVPERKDDFAWENNLVAFRMYGKALENTNENAFGIDVWAKRTSQLIIDKWYKHGDYHTDHGEGLDYYSVGFTLGGGDIAPFVDDSIYFSRNYERHAVLDNGPLRSTFQLFYGSWEVNGVSVTAIKEIMLDAGSQLNRITVQYQLDGVGQLPAVVGIIKRKDPGEIYFDEERKIMGYWEPPYKNEGKMGIGCILVGGMQDFKIQNGHLLSLITAKNHQPIVYYAGAAWNKAKQITTPEEWFHYLTNFADKIDHPVDISVL